MRQPDFDRRILARGLLFVSASGIRGAASVKRAIGYHPYSTAGNCVYEVHDVNVIEARGRTRGTKHNRAKINADSTIGSKCIN